MQSLFFSFIDYKKKYVYTDQFSPLNAAKAEITHEVI